MQAAHHPTLWPEIPADDKSSALALHAQLMFTQWMKPDLLQFFLLRQFELLLRHAWASSPYYQSTLELLKTLQTGGLYEGHLAFLPVMSCGDLQKNGQKIIVRKPLAGHGGTRMILIEKPTGPPIRMIVNGLLDSWARALELRSQEWNSTDVSGARVKIDKSGGRKDAGHDHWSDVPWSGPSHHLSERSPPGDLFGELLRIDPASLQATPKVLNALAELSAARGIKPQNLREVKSRGQYLDPGLRALIRETWGLHVTQEYFIEELGVIAHQCPEGRHLHVHSEFARVEILDELNKPCSPGQAGRVIVTPLQNFQTPLIRYDTGNHAKWGESCSCGRSLPVLQPISV